MEFYIQLNNLGKKISKKGNNEPKEILEIVDTFIVNQVN